MKIICPICNNYLKKFNNTYNCCNKHSFDISKNGYVNLLISKVNSGDNKLMITARHNFLEKNYYSFLAKQLLEIINDINPNTIIDIGCGEGYFTSFLKDNYKVEYIGLDISKEAIKFASKKHDDIIYLVSNIKHIPIDNCDLILNIMAPHNNEEFKRILNNNGYLIKVIPGSNHLIELKKYLYDDVYLNDSVINNLNSFEIVKEIGVERNIKIDNMDLNNLFMMTPYYYKTSKVDFCGIKDIDITFSFKIIIYKKGEEK